MNIHSAHHKLKVGLSDDYDIVFEYKRHAAEKLPEAVRRLRQAKEWLNEVCHLITEGKLQEAEYWVDSNAEPIAELMDKTIKEASDFWVPGDPIP